MEVQKLHSELAQIEGKADDLEYFTILANDLKETYQSYST